MVAGYIILFDIGGTYVRGELRRGRRLVKRAAAHIPKSLDKFEALLVSLVKKLIPARGQVARVEIGVAGIVSGSKIVRSPNIPYLKNYDFRKLVPQGYKLLVDNDARMFLKRQLELGVANHAKRVLALTIGTGIGRAYAEGGKVKRLKAFEHPETWEKDYQRVRFRSSAYLAKFLAHELRPIIKKYRPELIVLGGGVISRKKGFFAVLDSYLTGK